MEEKIKETMAAVFGLDVSSISSDATPENIEVWDSLKHMNLIIALEEEFDVEFNDEDIPQLISIKSIVDIVKTRQEN